MAAMATDSPSPAPAAANHPTPPYLHSPAEKEVATPPPKPTGQRSPLPSPLQLSGYSLHDLLLLSPSPTSRRSRSRQRGAAAPGVDSSLEMAGTPPRRMRRAAAAAGASPRNARRARRRLEKEAEPEEDAIRKARRRKPTWAAPKVVAAAAVNKAVPALPAAAEKEEDMSLALVSALADATHVTRTDAPDQSGWESLWGRIFELVLWRDAAKSALWFGLGSMFFMSCSFSREITFSPISAFCHLGVLILGLAFLKDSVPQRRTAETGRNFRLTEEDLLRAAGAVLPVANSMISTAQVIFSGDPSMTLKVLPVLLFGAKYGSLVTLWRLLATGFFSSFTLPKLYMCYSTQIHGTVENFRDRALEAWKYCPRKKLVAGIAVTMFWNLFSIKTRFVAAFIAVVILRYNHQYRKADVNPEVECCQDDQEIEVETEVKP